MCFFFQHLNKIQNQVKHDFFRKMLQNKDYVLHYHFIPLWITAKNKQTDLPCTQRIYDVYHIPFFTNNN